MNIEEVRDYCLQIKGAIESMPFGDDGIVFKICGKMFIFIDLQGKNTIALKCEPTYAQMLREQYMGIQGAFHFNKKHWNSVLLESDVPQSLIYQLITHSVNEVIKKLTKKERLNYERQ